MVISAIEIVAKKTTVHNFEVTGYHTYYVSKERVLVHNNGPCPVKYKGGGAPNKIGTNFEKENGIVGKADRETYVGASNKSRIVDYSDDVEILETKANNSYVQHFSTQIKDGYQHALNTGRRYRLKLSRPDKITKPLKEAAAKSNGRFVIH